MVCSQNYRVSPNCGCAYSSHLRADISYQDFICSKHCSSWLELQLLWMHALLWLKSQLRLQSLSVVENEIYTLSGHLWEVFQWLMCCWAGILWQNTGRQFIVPWWCSVLAICCLIFLLASNYCNKSGSPVFQQTPFIAHPLSGAQSVSSRDEKESPRWLEKEVHREQVAFAQVVKRCGMKCKNNSGLFLGQ